MKRTYLFLLSLCLGIAAREAVAAGVSVQFVNKSSLTIHHIYLSEANEKEWGEDQLGNNETDTIEPGASFTLTDITPNLYDLKLVDADGDECIVGGVKLKASESVTLTNELLIGCQAASAGEEDGE
jgi:hypothetical protein